MEGAEAPPAGSLKRTRSPTQSTSEELADPNTAHILARKRSASAESFRTPSSPAPPFHIPSSSSAAAAAMDVESSAVASHAALAPPSLQQVPPLDEQVQKINSLKNKPLHTGDQWFIVAKPWYRRWDAACSASPDSDSKDHDDVALSVEDIGPVENASLLRPGSNTLLKAPVEGVDAEFLPQEAWDLLKAWYGVKDQAIQRTVISYGSIPGGERIEFFPPVFYTLLACEGDSASGPSSYKDVDPVLRLSAGDTIAHLRESVADIYGLADSQKPIKLFRIDESSGTSLAESKQPAPGYALVEGLQRAVQLEPCADGFDDQTLIDAQMDDPSTFLAVDFKPYKLADATSSAGLEDQRSQVPFSFGSNKFANTLGSRPSASSSTSGNGMTVKYKSGKSDLIPTSTASSPSSYPSSSSSLVPSALDLNARITRSRSQLNSDRTKGLCGLGNLGNTCFMNSALQCLSNTPELREYFQTGAYRSEINRDNPLGMSGKVAQEFGHLIQKLWSGNSTSYTPREFKAMIGRFRPMFIGWSQQDSQELLSFLLDGLHEDLNRIYKKPATTKPEWEGGGDLEMMKMAKESWRLFKLRNDSVIVDLFQGMYRSTVVCPDCKKISITFDAFTSLTLPLPPREWSGEVWVMPADPSKPRYRIALRLPDGSTVRKAKTAIAAEIDGVEANNLYAVECYGSKMWKAWVDEDAITQANADVGSRNPPNDYITFYELPFPYEQLALNRFREESKLLNDRHRDVEAGRIVVPVLFGTKQSKAISSSSPSFFGLPIMLGLERKDATTYEAVQEAVIRQVARLTKNGADFFESPEAPAAETDGSAEATETQKEPVSADQETSSTPVENGSSSRQSEEENIIAPPPLPPKGTPIISKAFNIYVADRRGRNVNIGSSAAQDLTYGKTKLRDRIKQYAEAEKSDMPGSLPEAPTADKSVEEEEDEELKKRYEDVQPPSPVIETGDVLFVEFSDAAYKHFFADASLMAHDQAAPAGKPLPPSRKRETVSLDACLDEFSKVEQLDAMNTWYCPQCKDHKEATKQVDLWSLPDILVIHLKRFSASRYGSRDKITDKVDFPLEGLDLAPRVIERKIAKDLAASGDAEAAKENELDSESLVYDLYAVDNHYGGMGGGHYTSYAKNVEDGQWYDFDDSRVSPIAPEQAKTSAAYLLFYRRRTSRPFGGKSREVIAEAHLDAQLPEKEDSDVHMDSPAAADRDAPDQDDDDQPLYGPSSWNLSNGHTFGTANEMERSQPQWSSASSSAAQGGSPRSKASSPDLWNNDDFVPPASSPSVSDTESDDESREPWSKKNLNDFEPDFAGVE